jgi:hypothetical protein
MFATRDREPKTLRRFFRIVVSKMKSSAQDFWHGAVVGKRLHLCSEFQFGDGKTCRMEFISANGDRRSIVMRIA